jgi:hypothetical protein
MSLVQMDPCMGSLPSHTVSDEVRRTKAVANGALAWYLDHSVTARINKYHYGVQVRIRDNPFNPDFDGRRTMIGNDGTYWALGAWSPIVNQVDNLPYMTSETHTNIK